MQLQITIDLLCLLLIRGRGLKMDDIKRHVIASILLLEKLLSLIAITDTNFP
jgi:hypothetical protein